MFESELLSGHRILVSGGGSGLGFAIWLSRRREVRGQGGWRKPAVSAAMALLIYISANGVISNFAFAAPARDAPYARPDTVVVSPPPVLFWERNVIWREGHGLWSGDFSPFVSLTALSSYSGPTDDGMDDPLARRTLYGDPRLARFARWSILPMATIDRQRCFVRISYHDARFGLRQGRGRLGQTVALATGAPGC